jgi:hypothetical protein
MKNLIVGFRNFRTSLKIDYRLSSELLLIPRIQIIIAKSVGTMANSMSRAEKSRLSKRRLIADIHSTVENL